MIDLSNKRSLYRIYKKKKPNGKYRAIHAPQGELKNEQVALAKKLSAMYEPLDCVYGYIKGRSTSDLANNHIGKDWLITIDIEDFFPSITKPKLLALGLTDYEAEIATLGGKCVQGSPCSPVISNLIMQDADKKLDILFREIMGMCYTRYSDDIQLSGSMKPHWQYVKVIKTALEEEGFKINEKKIKFMFKNQRQEILGICVNDKPSIDRKRRSQLKFRAKRGMLTESDKGMISYIHGVMK